MEVLQEDTFLANINNNEELLLARIVTPDLESSSQLALQLELIQLMP